MGVSINEILRSRFFKDYYLIAGTSDMNISIQGVVLFDAPDGYKWMKGGEFVLTTGYFFKDNIEHFKEVIKFLNSKGNCALGIKKDRFLKEIPEEIVNLCNKIAFPLINIPYEVAWIDIINAINSIVMNRFIIRINEVNYMSQHFTSNNFYKKIENIMICLSKEVNCPISIIDTIDNKLIIYPTDFKSKKELKVLLGNVLSNYQKELLSEQLNIYRITDMSNKKSWIEMDIKINSSSVSKLIVWEKNRKIDYYDMFALELSYSLIMEVYEQIYVMNSFEKLYYDDLIKSLVNGTIDCKWELIRAKKKIHNFRLNIDSKFICLILKLEEKNLSFYSIREKIYGNLLLKIPKNEAIFGIVDDNILVIIKDVSKYKSDAVKNVQKEFRELLEKTGDQFKLKNIKVGIGDITDDICSIKRSYIEALKAIEVGKYIYPDKRIISFEDLGLFGLFRIENIQRKNFENTLKTIYPIFKESNWEELLTTLKVYLESASNSNVTAEKLFVHSNTVRYRISKIKELCNVDLEDSTERLKMEITLKFIEVLKKEFKSGNYTL
ncbi:PucR family transcriptional regulator ligand-binding domain-containing protein [Schnuerera sp. xch1]|uniref:PucR family transcriptional regulator n=1 Tax=Schnuerera sp. xch1 TaxID=2874283 RepID=UPI001CBA83E2|nr:PucR family transcriptional regulator ligand-binding domain-containing protein [Schnuerera sp. xch1]MBZ2175489.1 PucR family transcriptional regulator ligand-binding domain-containing protein [Schnuerera sp. xch1]